MRAAVGRAPPAVRAEEASHKGRIHAKSVYLCGECQRGGPVETLLPGASPLSGWPDTGTCIAGAARDAWLPMVVGQLTEWESTDEENQIKG